MIVIPPSLATILFAQCQLFLRAGPAASFCQFRTLAPCQHTASMRTAGYIGVLLAQTSLPLIPQSQIAGVSQNFYSGAPKRQQRAPADGRQVPVLFEEGVVFVFASCQNVLFICRKREKCFKSIHKRRSSRTGAGRNKSPRACSNRGPRARPSFSNRG